MKKYYEIVIDKGNETEGIISFETKKEAIMVMWAFDRFIEGSLFVAEEE